MHDRPLCFVLMPFGSKPDAHGRALDFDAIYDEGIRPGIEDAGMRPIRADEERSGGVVHGPMFERLMLCDYAVADLTTANANVFYELGVRHAVRPNTTLPLFLKGERLPFDVGPVRSLAYTFGAAGKFDAAAAKRLRKSVGERLKVLKEEKERSNGPDSPVFQLVQGYEKPDLAHLITDRFREQAEYAANRKAELARARVAGEEDAVHSVEAQLAASPAGIGGAEAGVLVDLFLSYRAVKAYERMVQLYERLPIELQRAVMVREQLGFALNRLGRRDEAQTVLEKILAENGPSSETLGLIGRIHKDRFLEAREAGKKRLAKGALDAAIARYEEGYLCDIRDAFPGINAVTLLEVRGDKASRARRDELLPAVRLAVEVRLAGSKPDYWDLATRLELDVLAGDKHAARSALEKALAAVREKWEPETTARNLRLILDARRERGERERWLEKIVAELEEAAR